MKHTGIVLGMALALVTLCGPSAGHAAARARTLAETVVSDSPARLSTGIDHACQVNGDGTVRCWGQNISGQLGDGTFGTRTTPVLVTGLTSAVAVAAGDAHTCALLADGSVRCWGSNVFGQVGDGTTVAIRVTPVPVSGLTDAVAISAGGLYTCALLASGGARCWGANGFGQLGDGTTFTRRAPVVVSGLADAVAIAAGEIHTNAEAHTCALLADGTARCWGANRVGQLGDGTTIRRLTPVPVIGLTDAVAIVAGEVHTCALLADGSARCWGNNSFGQLGDDTTITRLTPVVVSGLTDAVAIAAGAVNTSGEAHTCALLASGGGRCWGANGVGQLGDSTTLARLTPVPVSGLTNAVAIAVGGGFTCALVANGSARCWGENTSGKLGNGTVSNSPTPSTVAGGGGSVTARDIAAGSSHTCAVRADGTVACWGDNGNGQVGDGTLTTRLAPVPVGGLTGAVAIAAGDFHTCALLASGTARCWGDNSAGQLGDGTLVDRRTPVPVSGLAGAVAIAAGGFHTCALLASGTARCWGANADGQLGRGIIGGPQPLPAPVSLLTDAVAIAAGGAHTCALLADGDARCWGSGDSGQLGDGGLATLPTPTPVVGLASPVALAAGDVHTCAVQLDTTARCWGANLNGSLGNGTTTPATTPDTVLGLNDAVRVAAGAAHTCALLARGTVRCWGDNSAGQLGDGTTTQRPSPTDVTIVFLRRTPGGGVVTVAPLANVVQLATGRRHTCAIIANGSARCWGENVSGQLGNDTTTDAHRPSVVLSFTLNIDPQVLLEHNTRVATVTVLATCDDGQELHVAVTLDQGAVSGRGVGGGACTGGLERYPVTVPAEGRQPFGEGPAVVEAEGLVRDRGLIVDSQEWTRQVQILSAP